MMRKSEDYFQNYIGVERLGGRYDPRAGFNKSFVVKGSECSGAFLNSNIDAFFDEIRYGRRT